MTLIKTLRVAAKRVGNTKRVKKVKITGVMYTKQNKGAISILI